MNFFKDARALKLAAILGAALAIAACSKNPDELGGVGAGGGVGMASSSGVATPGSPQDFTVNVGDRVFFDTDSTELSSRAQSILNRQARWLAQYPNYNFIIEGHADERGTREYNFALGARRAEITKEYLVAKGISPSRMRTISYGKERPVAVCNNESCWSQNRRAVTVLRNAGQS
ncbi:MAG TPA: peptidoglycan-associated lipoprotein Pal [Beijerinckiaceae bacterium]|nr:peptidoglycan-associated lipoprotein Pal [Beijerinckiaceae bacterium]